MRYFSGSFALQWYNKTALDVCEMLWMTKYTMIVMDDSDKMFMWIQVQHFIWKEVLFQTEEPFGYTVF